MGGWPVVPSFRPFEKTNYLKQIAATGNNKGRAILWSIAGCPDILTEPEPLASGAFSPFFNVYEKDEKGRWVECKLPSRLPSWHPGHVCGIFCDGQDGNGQCSDGKRDGPPGDIDYLAYEEIATFSIYTKRTV